jgi:hypothetical protein
MPLNWIKHSFYFTKKKRRRRELFSLDIEGVMGERKR